MENQIQNQMENQIQDGNKSGADKSDKTESNYKLSFVEHKLKTLTAALNNISAVIDNSLVQSDIENLSLTIRLSLSEAYSIDANFLQEQFDLKPTHDRVKLCEYYVRTIRNAIDRIDGEIVNAQRTLNELSERIEEIPNEEL